MSRERTTVPDQFRWIDGWLIGWARWIGGDRKEISKMLDVKSQSFWGSGGSTTADTFDIETDKQDVKQYMIIDSILRHLDDRLWMALQKHYCHMEGKHRGSPQEVFNEALAVMERLAVKAGVDMGNQPVRGRVRRVA